jgi:hypothetical protein
VHAGRVSGNSARSTGGDIAARCPDPVNQVIAQGGAVFTVSIRPAYAGQACETSRKQSTFFDGMSGPAQPQLTLPVFQAVVGTEFQFQLTEQQFVTLVLVEARARRSATGSASGESFALLFHGPAEPPLAQRMYSCTQAALGTFDIFIVPVGRDQNSFHYEAVFNLQPQ